jgi:hypothetical protein
LLALREFAGMQNHQATKALALVNRADKLADRSIWLCIGNDDRRVDTDRAMAFTRKVVQAAAARNKQADLELHVMPVPNHRTHASAHGEAAAWLLRSERAGK